MQTAYLAPGSRSAAVAGATVGAVVTIGYAVLANDIQHSLSGQFLTAFLACLVVAGLVSATPLLDERGTQALRFGTSSGYFVAGLASLASIGLFLVIAAFLSYIAVGPRRISQRLTGWVVALPAVAFVGGTVLTLG